MQDKMERILLCYAIEDPEVGYVQSMNIIVSSILYHVRDEAKTFAIVRKIFHQMRTVYLKGIHLLTQTLNNVMNT